MPIYDQTYRKYEARGPLRSVRFWPITREALRLLLAKKAFLALWAACWLPFIGFVIYLWGVTQFAQAPQVAEMLPSGAQVFGRYFHFQILLVFILSTFGGAGLIANDLRTGGILVYLSRPLTRRDYVAGKLGVLLGLNLSVTLVPGLLLYLVSLGLAPDRYLRWSLAWVPLAIAAYALTLSLSASLLLLAISALSRSARVAGLAFFGLVTALDIVRGVVGAIYRWPGAILLSLQANVLAIDNALFGIEERGYGIHWAYPAVVLTVLGLACLLILRTRVRAVEIVK